MKPLIIDKDNFNYLVRKDISKYYVSVCYAIPRKSKKGYLGMKHKHQEFRTTKEDALQKFENWKEEYVPKFYKKEIICLFIRYSPIIYYYTTCPKCGKDAEIINWMLIMGTGIGEAHDIICKHCCPSNYPPDALFNRVGECRVILFNNKEEEKEINLQFNNSGIKWEDWLRSLND